MKKSTAQRAARLDRILESEAQISAKHAASSVICISEYSAAQRSNDPNRSRNESAKRIISVCSSGWNMS